MDTVKLLNVYRPVVPVAGAGGEPGGLELAECLVVEIGRASNVGVVDRRELAFADYAGLEAEWDGGSATSVLAAAVNTDLAARSFATGGLTPAQRAVLGYEVSIA